MRWLCAADSKSYSSGQSITLSFVNGSSIAYGSDASCTTPIAVWLRGSDGATYFINSGAPTRVQSWSCNRPRR